MSKPLPPLSRLMSDAAVPERPQVHSAAVIFDTVDRLLPEFSAWYATYVIAAYKNTRNPITDVVLTDADLRSVLVEAVASHDDAFAATQACKELYALPVNDAFYKLMSLYMRLRHAVVKEHVTSWVMSTGFRTPAAENDLVRFADQTDPDKRLVTGLVLAVVAPEARLIVEPVRSKGDVVSILAEDLSYNLGPKKPSTKEVA